MNGDWRNTPQATWLVLLLILPIAAIAGRRIGWRRGSWMLLAWIAIFAAGWLIVAIVQHHADDTRHDGAMTWMRNGAHRPGISNPGLILHNVYYRTLNKTVRIRGAMPLLHV